MHQKKQEPLKVSTERWFGGKLSPWASISLRCGETGPCPKPGLRGPSAFQCLPQNVLTLSSQQWMSELGTLSLHYACVGHGLQKPIPQNFLDLIMMT